MKFVFAILTLICLMYSNMSRADLSCSLNSYSGILNGNAQLVGSCVGQNVGAPCAAPGRVYIKNGVCSASNQAEVLYQFKCPSYSGEVYQDRAVIRELNYKNHINKTVAYYAPKDENKDFKLKYNKLNHELELIYISGEMSEIGYIRDRYRITLNLNTNDIVDAHDWMLVPIPFWKNLRERKIDGKECEVVINKLPLH